MAFGKLLPCLLVSAAAWAQQTFDVATINYQWTRNTNAATQSGLVPAAAERGFPRPAPSSPSSPPAKTRGKPTT